MTSDTSREDAHRIALIGAPIEVGTSEPGALMGPAALRTAGLVRTLSDL
ncbi:arginase, partial [Methylobacterium sp. WL18]